MSPLRVSAGLLTLVYALYLMVEGLLGLVTLLGPLTPRLTAVLGGFMQLTQGQPWWSCGLEALAGFTFAAAGAQMAGSRLSAWALFAMAAAAELIARWMPILARFPSRETLHELVVADQILLTAFGAGLTAYVMLDTPRPDLIRPQSTTGA